MYISLHINDRITLSKSNKQVIWFAVLYLYNGPINVEYSNVKDLNAFCLYNRWPIYSIGNYTENLPINFHIYNWTDSLGELTWKQKKNSLKSAKKGINIKLFLIKMETMNIYLLLIGKGKEQLTKLKKKIVSKPPQRQLQSWIIQCYRMAGCCCLLNCFLMSSTIERKRLQVETEDK